MAHQTYEWSLVETLWHRLILRKIILVHCLPPISWSRPGGLGASSVNGSEQWRKILQTNGKRRFNSTNEKNAPCWSLLQNSKHFCHVHIILYNGYPATLLCPGQTSAGNVPVLVLCFFFNLGRVKVSELVIIGHPTKAEGLWIWGLSSLTWITFSARDVFFCPRLMVSTRNQPTTKPSFNHPSISKSPVR